MATVAMAITRGYTMGDMDIPPIILIMVAVAITAIMVAIATVDR